ncbi:MAG: HAD-IB family hydrolase [Syntrophales bacterium]|nr:HAD-IB family hydrolase [Syntrophales bacterium]
MGRVAAVFDVDQTLIQGATERLFFRYLVRQGLLPKPRALSYLGGLALNPKERFRDKTYLKGLPVAETLELARRCYQEEIAPRLSAAGVACLREHQAQGHDIVLLTGSLAFLTLPLKEELGADWLIATEMAHNGSSFAGEITGLHPRGENKLKLLLELARAQNLDLSRSFAYGDHPQDLHLFRRIGYPVAVNPSWRLKRQARRHQWPIRSF